MNQRQSNIALIAVILAMLLVFGIVILSGIHSLEEGVTASTGNVDYETRAIGLAF